MAGQDPDGTNFGFPAIIFLPDTLHDKILDCPRKEFERLLARYHEKECDKFKACRAQFEQLRKATQLIDALDCEEPVSVYKEKRQRRSSENYRKDVFSSPLVKVRLFRS